uniref:Putative secreted protein n=1 Tax=Anopheles darlingi TaxID=43151 RepID=A0A2M4DHU1_ANODA
MMVLLLLLLLPILPLILSLLLSLAHCSVQPKLTTNDSAPLVCRERGHTHCNGGRFSTHTHTQTHTRIL